MNKSKGATLIELLVAIAVIGIVFVAVFAILRMVVQSSATSEARTAATGLSNQQMETIRNLPYDDIGTTDGWPQGDIESTRTEELNSITYTINTSVNYVDDPFDDVVPTDNLGADYKKVKVEVTWDKFYSGRSVVLYTDISPRGIEELEEAGGVLSITVFDANNQPVPGATINVVNNNLGLNITDYTGNDGERTFYSLTPDSGANYEIQITKDGYTSDHTSEISASLPDPDNPHRSIFEGQVEEASFTIDIPSTLSINTIDDGGASLGNIPVMIEGERRIGLNGDNEPVLRNTFYGQSTDGSGLLTLSEVEWDSYNISEEDPSYDIAEIVPANPNNVAPGDDRNSAVTLVPHADNTLRVIVRDNDDQAIEGASVRLYGSGFDETQETSAAGQVFFTPLSQTSYNLEITADSYVDFSDAAEVEEQTVRELIMASQS